MTPPSPGSPIRIVAALIDDDRGCLPLVRKKGSPWFMQPGGKIKEGESPEIALHREPREEIGLSMEALPARHLGHFSAPAANEAGHLVMAEVFHIRAPHLPVATAEIEEALWVDPAQAAHMPLAPLTRDHILPLAASLF